MLVLRLSLPIEGHVEAELHVFASMESNDYSRIVFDSPTLTGNPFMAMQKYRRTDTALLAVVWVAPVGLAGAVWEPALLAVLDVGGTG
jgi:hypothetical protein